MEDCSFSIFSHDCYVKYYYFKEDVLIVIFISIIHDFMLELVPNFVRGKGLVEFVFLK